jgi:hypothetical protein
LASLLATAAGARAQQPPVGAPVTQSAPATRPERGPDVHRLTVHAAPATRPALQYRLLPDLTERTAGNAAQVYLLSFLQALQVPQDARKLTEADAARLGVAKPEYDDRLDFYLHEVPLERLSNADVEQFLGKYQSALAQLDVAARRDQCDWDLPREQGFGLLLPHLSSARDLARLGALRVRLEIARHDYPAAVRGLKTEMGLARDVGAKPLMIEALVGIGVAALSFQQVETLVQQPDAPNLYWPLADLPRPFVDVAAAMREERSFMVARLPDMRRIKEGRFSAEDWESFTAKLAHLTDSAGAKRPIEAKLAPVAAAVVLYPAAKQYLIRRGVPGAEVEGMPVPAVLARFYLESFDEWWDEMLKWTSLPFWEAYPGMRWTEAAIGQAKTGVASNPLLSIMPSFSRAYFQGAKLDRQIAALRTVEALRNYAATHDGRPPANLADITDTPAPADPTTGKPFLYQVQGNRVTLESPAPEKGWEPRREGLRVEVTFVK